MLNTDSALHKLCRRVAAGDADAQEQFDREVAPLIALIARQAATRDEARRRTRGRAPEAAGSPEAAPIKRPLAASRLASRICRALIEKVAMQSRQPDAETLVSKIPQRTRVFS